MQKWGACWGAFFGLLLGWWGDDVWVLISVPAGAGLGFLLAQTLRGALRQEWQAMQASQAGQGAKAPQPQGQQETQPQAQPQSMPASTQPARQRLLAPTKLQQVQVEVQTAAQAVSPAEDPANWLAPAHAALHSQAPAVVPPAPAWLQALQNSISAWFTGGNAVVRLGFLLLFIGLAFLAKFAADAGLFPPALRMAGLAAVGVVFLGLGWRLRQRAMATASARSGRLAYAYTLQGAGVAVLYLTIFEIGRAHV